MISVDQLTRPTPARVTAEHPLDHLVACHQRVEDRLVILERAASQLNDQPRAAREVLHAVFRFFETAGVLHTRDEEESVFPRLMLHVNLAERSYLANLTIQHREAEEVYSLLQDEPPVGSDLTEYLAMVHRFCALYRAHIASENEHLIDAARRLLSPEEIDEVGDEMRERRHISTNTPVA